MIKIKDILTIIKKFYKYYTFWVLTITILYYLGDFEDYYLDLVFLHLMISMITLYIVYVEPKILHIDLGIIKYDLEGPRLIISDILLHHIPLLLLLANPGKMKKSYLFLLLPLFYRLFNSPKDVYGINDIVSFMIYSFCTISYLLF
jgi:hypothetical protein